jgi:hypothetical protein
VTDDIATLKRLDQAAIAVREYAGSTQAGLAVSLLNELEASYLDDLRNCRPEELAGLQACLKQCDALRQIFKGEPNTNGRI